MMSDKNLYCPQCGYNLRAIPENRCPECGFGYNREGIESFCVMEAHERNVILHRVQLLSSISACSALFRLADHPAVFVTILVLGVVTQTSKKPQPPKPPRFFQAPISWMIYAGILMLVLFPLYIARPDSATIVAIGSALVAWCLLLWPARGLNHHHLNLTAPGRRSVERYRTMTLLWIVTASVAALLCLT
jgi:hypothetical protein